MFSATPYPLARVSIASVALALSASIIDPVGHVLGADLQSSGERFERCGITMQVEDQEAWRFADAVAARHAAIRACHGRLDKAGAVVVDDLALCFAFHFRTAIPGFCTTRDYVYDVRCFHPLTRELKWVIWLNAKDGAALLWGVDVDRPMYVAPRADKLVIQLHEMEVPGAKVATPSDAARAARHLYPSDVSQRAAGNFCDYQTRVTDLKSVQIAIPGFAQKGDRVWEAICWPRSQQETLVWVHAQSGNLHFLTEPWKCVMRDSAARPRTARAIRAAVQHVQDATDENAEIVSAFTEYMMWEEGGDRGVTWNPSIEGIGVRYVMRLGFDIAGFAQRGERIWECHLSDGFGTVRRVIWVNPKAAKVFCLSREFERAPL